MPPAFRFVQADPESFDDLDGFDVDYTGVFNGVAAKYTTVVDELDTMAPTQEQPLATTQPAEKHRRRKKRSNNAASHALGATETTGNSHMREGDRAVSAYTYLMAKDYDPRRSLSARSPSPTSMTAAQQAPKQTKVPVASNRHGNETNTLDYGDSKENVEVGEKKHRKRKVKKRTTQAYGSEPTPGPLTERTNDTANEGASEQLSDKDSRQPTQLLPANIVNPYKQSRSSTASMNVFTISSSPINRPSGSRSSQEPYATSTPALPDTDSVGGGTTFQIGINSINNVSLVESIALELSDMNDERDVSIASELGMPDGTSIRHTSSSIKAAAPSPLTIHSLSENKSLGSNVMAFSTPKAKAAEKPRFVTDVEALPIPPSAPPASQASKGTEDTGETAALKAKIKELESEHKNSLLQRLEEERRSILLEQSLLASKLEQEKTKIADISQRIAQTSMAASMAVETEVDTTGAKYTDEDRLILGPTSSHDATAESVVGGDYGTGMVESIVKSPGPSMIPIRSSQASSLSNHNHNRVCNRHSNTNSKKNDCTVPRLSPDKANATPEEGNNLFKSDAKSRKSKSSLARPHKRHPISFSTSSSTSLSESPPSSPASYRHKNKRSRSSRNYYTSKRRAKSEYKHLYASIREMEARQFELLDRISELAKETKTVRSIGINSIGPDTLDGTPGMVSMGYTPGPFPTMMPSMGMVPMMPQVYIPAVQGMPYTGHVQTPTIHGAFVPQYAQCLQYPQYITPVHQSYPLYPAFTPSCHVTPTISSETAALISTLSHVIGTGPARPSVQEVVNDIMTNYGLSNHSQSS